MRASAIDAEPGLAEAGDRLAVQALGCGALAQQDGWPRVIRISGLVSFEPDKVEVHLDGSRLEPGQSVVAHGVDRDLTTDEVFS